ncbi:MAG: copper homeostasis protein CutC [Bacteroidota bacterium]
MNDVHILHPKNQNGPLLNNGKTFIKEACVETLTQAVNAERKGADRIELCADLSNDGLTPDDELIALVQKRVRVPVRVMIRPREGDFCYSDAELTTMKRAIDFCKNGGVQGVVFGVCKPDFTLDIETIRELAMHAKPLKVTIHKAIDTINDQVEGIRELSKLKLIDSVLSSGGKRTALEGIDVLKSMIENSGTIQVIACGKVTDSNLPSLHGLLNADAYHGKLIVGEI